VGRGFESRLRLWDCSTITLAELVELVELVELDEGTLLTMRVSSLDWMANVLAGWTATSRSAARTSSGGSVRALADRLAASS
jgi:hypothetical protein